MPRPLILAHRGDWSRAAENSLAAFLAALRRPGVDGVEFDIRAAADGTPVVIHDATLSRIHNRRRRVGDLSAQELEHLGIPALSRLLDALPPPFFLDIELKEDIATRAIPVIAQGRGSPPRDVAVSSFDVDSIAAVKSAAPDWRCWLITRRLGRDAIRSAVAARCDGIAVRWPALTRSGVALVADAGLELATWTVADRPTLERVSALALSAICVDPSALP